MKVRRLGWLAMASGVCMFGICPASTGPAVTIQQGGAVLLLENNLTRIAYNLDQGLFSIFSKADGSTILRDAGAGANGRSFAGRIKRTWREVPVEDSLGKGRSITVTTPGEEFELTQVFTLHDDRGSVILRGGIRNTSPEPVRLRELTVIENGRVWPGVSDADDPKTLDGLSGWDRFQQTKTRVEDGSTRWSYNNLLYTFKHAGSRHSLVFGGLVYRDFAAIATIDDGVVQLAGQDPLGRRIGVGEFYLPQDRYFLNGALPDPFESLEDYGRAVATANDVQLNPYTFPTVCAWYAFGYFHGKGGTAGEQNPDFGNNTPTCVREIDHARKAGFLNYAPVAIRLVPDKYHGDTEQGWWDDEHWRKFGHYRKPFETSEKFCRAVLERGGLPFTYVQTGMPSDDYAEAFPGRMMRDDISELSKLHRPHLPYVTFDYTDGGFQRHLAGVWGHLRKAGLRGVMFDYPETAWRSEGGFDDEDSTCAAAYRKVYEIARKGLGPRAFIHERNLGEPNTNSPESDGSTRAPSDGEPTPVLDNTVGLVDSQRVMGDTVDFTADQVRRCGLRWYKCRTLYAYDMDAKAMSPVEEERRAMLTMAYVVSGRLLLGTSFADMTPAMVHDLSRTFPYPTERRSARPIDLLQRDMPMVYDFDVTEDWHQLCLYNGRSTQEPTVIEVPISGARADGALGLEPAAEYYLYDFWNDRFAGRLKGTDTLRQTLRGGEARMLSIHKARTVPQFISTNRHLMQGYLDLAAKPEWDAADQTLTGTSTVVADDAYEVVIACNGRIPTEVKSSAGKATLAWENEERGIAVLALRVGHNADVSWRLHFR